MSGRHKLWNEYKEFLARSSSQVGARRRVGVHVGCILAVLLVYLLSFFDLYNHLYDVTPYYVRQFTFDIYPRLETIDAQMARRGDWTLFQKYLVFSQLNFAILVLSFIAGFISFEGKRDSNSEYVLGGHCLLLLAFVSLVLFVVFGTNDAGYGQRVRFPMEPGLGRGEFFFLRDSLFVGVSAWFAVHLAVMLRLMMQPTSRREHGGR